MEEDDGDTPFLAETEDETSELLCFEEEEEEEEARRLLAACSVDIDNQKKTKKKPSKKALVKCPECKTSFFTIDGYIKHKMTHRFAGKIIII